LDIYANWYTNPVRYLKFRNTLKGFSRRTLSTRLELEKSEILENANNEIPPSGV
jgi:hypothetical protein